MTVTVLRGVLGWGNRKSGLEAYGPGGRWGEGREGDLLGDALDRAGAHEGADLLVIAVDRFGDLSVIADVLAMLTQREGVEVSTARDGDGNGRGVRVENEAGDDQR